MTRPGPDLPQWAMVDEGWGRKADVDRVQVPFAWEFADPQLYARALAATGPAYEAMQNVGEAKFHRAAIEQAEAQLRDGLPLRAEIKVVGYLARKPEGAEQA